MKQTVWEKLQGGQNIKVSDLRGLLADLGYSIKEVNNGFQVKISKTVMEFLGKPEAQIKNPGILSELVKLIRRDKLTGGKLKSYLPVSSAEEEYYKGFLAQIKQYGRYQAPKNQDIPQLTITLRDSQGKEITEVLPLKANGLPEAAEIQRIETLLGTCMTKHAYNEFFHRQVAEEREQKKKNDSNDTVYPVAPEAHEALMRAFTIQPEMALPNFETFKKTAGLHGDHYYSPSLFARQLAQTLLAENITAQSLTQQSAQIHGKDALNELKLHHWLQGGQVLREDMGRIVDALQCTLVPRNADTKHVDYVCRTLHEAWDESLEAVALRKKDEPPHDFSFSLQANALLLQSFKPWDAQVLFEALSAKGMKHARLDERPTVAHMQRLLEGKNPSLNQYWLGELYDVLTEEKQNGSEKGKTEFLGAARRQFGRARLNAPKPDELLPLQDYAKSICHDLREKYFHRTGKPPTVGDLIDHVTDADYAYYGDNKKASIDEACHLLFGSGDFGRLMQTQTPISALASRILPAIPLDMHEVFLQDTALLEETRKLFHIAQKGDSAADRVGWRK